MRSLILVALVALPAIGGAQLLPSPTPERCAAAPSNTAPARDWLERAASAVLPTAEGMILRYRASHDIPLWEQSDRMYEPFIPRTVMTDRWVDVATGVEARQAAERPVARNQYPSSLTSATMSFAGRDTTIRALPSAAAAAAAAVRLENPWLVLSDWRRDAAAVRLVQRCFYRDAWRVVLQRGADRLYLSESDAVPVKLERTEPHYLWGQVRAEYLWSTWWGVAGGGLFPYASFRLFDGTVYERIGIVGTASGALSLIPRDSAPRLSVPADAVAPSFTPPNSATPDTVRIAENTYLLVTPSYTQTVALRRDTVFLLDATTSEARSRGDSTMIARLFPGRHPVVVVVTDLAWPHISGVRFWVARGATIVSHAGSRDFLSRVVERIWTLSPDALESRKPRPAFRFRAVTDSLRLAGGDLVVHALRGTSTEQALGVWFPRESYFWAGDYVQNGADSPYARDVVRTINALGLSPAKIGAQHIKLTDWNDLVTRTPPVR